MDIPGPFHEAAKKGHLNLCKFFNENAKGKSPISDIGWSPIHAAAFMGKHLVCEWLMKNTEDKNLTDWLGSPVQGNHKLKVEF